jgi:flagellar basal-body rod modification protein FlgD
MSALVGIGGNNLGTDTFLKLFTTQVQMQNPMNPMESNDFLTQLAQFSTVEQMSGMHTSFQEMLDVQQKLQATDLVGKMVDYQPEGDEAVGSGRVNGVVLGEDGPVLQVGAKSVPLAEVVAIYEQQQAP